MFSCGQPAGKFKNMKEKTPENFSHEDSLFEEHKDNLRELRVTLKDSPIVQAYEKVMKIEKFTRTMDTFDLWKAFDEHPDIKLYQKLLFTENEIKVPEEKEE